MPSLSLRTRLLAAFGVALIALCGALLVNILQLREIGASLELVEQLWLPLGRQANRMSSRLERSTGTVELRDPLAATTTLISDLPADIPVRESLAVSDVRRILEEVEGAERRYNASVGTAAADRSRAELQAQIERLSELASHRLAALSARTVRAENQAERTSLITAILSLALVLPLGLLVHAALRPVQELTRRARLLEQGQNPSPVEVEGDHEVAVLARAFRRMADAVAERDRRLTSLSELQREVLDRIGAAVALDQDGLRLFNPAAHRLWGESLPAALRALPEGDGQQLALGERLHLVSIQKFGDGRLYVGEDVTEARQAAERLARAERLALVGQMLAQVTHEVRNPLNAIGLHVELLADEITAPEAAAVLATIQSQVRRLEALTQGYLDLARPRHPHRERLDPLGVVQGILDFEGPALRAAGIGWNLEGTGGQLCLDAAMIRQILLNLLRNAREAGAHQIHLKLHTDEAQLHLQVSDDGPGMDAETARHIFEPFFSTRATGTGLGLAVTRQLVEEAGGQIFCTTSPGAGACFSVVLPALQEEKDAEDPGGG
ncbi:MAG TPA: ATP-binding protein [Myxococcota bacterium]|nr:ATP-binding protein [Myxococcota bacterium]